MHNTPLLFRKKEVSGIRRGDDSRTGEREGKTMYTMGQLSPIAPTQEEHLLFLFLVSRMKLNNKRKTSLPLTVQCGLGQLISHPMRNVYSPGGYEGETNWQMRAPC